MYTRKLFYLGVGVVFATLALTACGSPAEEQAPASAATDAPEPTSAPEPTATPTPLPYDVTVTVTDADGNPIVGAAVALPESGNGMPVAVDDAGQVGWMDLPGEAVTLNMSAPGYFGVEQTVILERGPNDVAVSLERDPLGLTAVDACAPGETLLYTEDFQDGEASGWPEVQFNAPGWSLGPDPDEADNTVMTAQYTDALAEGPVFSFIQEIDPFENAAWRMRFMMANPMYGQSVLSFNWLHANEPVQVDGEEVFDSRYQIPVAATQFAVRRVQQPLTNIEAARGFPIPSAGQWHFIEMGTYQGKTEVWVDGASIMTYEDPVPLPPGTVSLEFWPGDETHIVYFDDMSICELSAPFAPMPSAEEEG